MSVNFLSLSEKGKAMALFHALTKKFGFAERWLKAGADYTQQLPLSPEWYEGLEVAGYGAIQGASSESSESLFAACFWS